MTSHLHRRTFLRSAGIALGLPLLDSMVRPAKLLAAEATVAPTRLAFVFMPNGAIMQQWTPKQTGRDYALSQSLQPLADLKGEFSVLSGLDHDKAKSNGDGAGDHARCSATYLTGVQAKKTGGKNIRLGKSVDQIAADAIGDATRFPSIQLSAEHGLHGGSCDSGYSCIYSSNISWRSETQPAPNQSDPTAAFERLFALDGNDLASRQLQAARLTSVLDFVADDAKRLGQKLGRTDRRKIGEYFQSVREVEQRVQRAARFKDPELPPGTEPPEAPNSTHERVRLMYDIMALAFQTDSTRVMSLMLGNAGSNVRYQQLGVEEGHHELSHHQNHEDKLERLQRIDEYRVQDFARFLQRLQDTPEGDGNLLDNSMIVFGSGIADPNRHHHDDLPCILAGGGGGKLNPGQHLKFDNTPMTNLFVSLLDKVGVDVDHIGDSTGRVESI